MSWNIKSATGWWIFVQEMLDHFLCWFILYWSLSVWIRPRNRKRVFIYTAACTSGLYIPNVLNHIEWFLLVPPQRLIAVSVLHLCTTTGASQICICVVQKYAVSATEQIDHIVSIWTHDTVISILAIFNIIISGLRAQVPFPLCSILRS